METFRDFSTHYAEGVTAIAAVAMFMLALITLLYLRREYAHKYRPQVTPKLDAVPKPEKGGFAIFISPRNVGAFPSKVRLTDILLRRGAEEMPGHDSVWQILLPSVKPDAYSIGFVTDDWVGKGRRRNEREPAELLFVIHFTNIDGKFLSVEKHRYLLDPVGDAVHFHCKPEWIEKLK